MPEWSSYSLSDFLMYSPRAYERLVELYNSAIWPAHVVAVVIGLILIGLAWRRHDMGMRFLMVLLSACWAWIAWAFLHERYASLHWAGHYMAMAYLFQALLLLAVARFARHAAQIKRTAYPAIAGYGLMIAGIAFFPLAQRLSGVAWSQSEVFGLMPTPTAIATLGVLTLMRGWQKWLGCAVPISWLVYSGATRLAMASQGF